MERLVFVIRHLPVPARSGALIRAQRLLTALAAEFECTLVYPGSGEAVSPELVGDALPGIDVCAVPTRSVSRRRRQVESLARRASAEFGMEATPDLRRAVAREVRRREARLVHFDDVTAALTGPLPGAVNVFAPHNVEHRILLDTARHARGPRAAFAAFDGRKLRREEQRLWRAMDVCVAVSDVDARTFRANGAREVLVCPNGTDPVERLPAPVRARGERLRMLFVGTGGYQPNRHGLVWLMDEVLTQLGDVPFKLDVVGTPPGLLPDRTGVTYHGQVESVDRFYETAHVAVVPILHGSGTRLKVVEAMARGRPVVSTAVGAEGLGLVPGRDYLQGDDPAAFAESLRAVAARLEGRGEPLEPMLGRARAAAEPLFWPVVGARLAADYRRLL